MDIETAAAACKCLQLGARVDEAIQYMRCNDQAHLAKLQSCRDFYNAKIHPTFFEVLIAWSDGYSFSTAPLVRREAAWSFRSALEVAKITIDDLFFAGTLSEHVDMEFVLFGVGKMGCTGSRSVNDLRRILIKIDPSKHHWEREILETLTHEMAHAYIRHFACPCDSDSCKVFMADINHQGYTGHGGYWQRLATEAENIVRGDWDHLAIEELGIEDAAVAELQNAVPQCENALAYAQEIFGPAEGALVLEKHYTTRSEVWIRVRGTGEGACLMMA